MAEQVARAFHWSGENHADLEAFLGPRLASNVSYARSPIDRAAGATAHLLLPERLLVLAPDHWLVVESDGTLIVLSAAAYEAIGAVDG